METALTRRTLLKTPAALAQPSGAPPNIVFLISDDHSYPDLGCNGNPNIRTPNLDRLAAEGVRFERCFVSSPQCSPNRSSIFTGCTPHTTSTSRLHTPMPDWEPSFLESLKARGYFTGAFRKVHQGPAFEKRFDYYGGPRAPFEEFFTRRPRNRPFFLHFGSTDPHRPYADGAFTPPHPPAQMRVPPFLPDTPAVRQDLAHYHDEIARFDRECGELLGLLDREGAANTLVIMTGDNGMPFPRAKGTCYDPGVHVPLIAWWKGRIAPGRVSRDLISHVDLPATWLDAASVPTPAKMQGRSFLKLLAGDSTYQPREAAFSERNWHDNFDPIRAVRTARHKLIFNAAPHFPYRPAWDIEGSPSWKAYLAEARAGRLTAAQRQLLAPVRPVLELYDLEADPAEFNNLATSPAHRETLDVLQQTLSSWMHDTLDFLPPGRSRPGEPGGRDWPLSL